MNKTAGFTLIEVLISILILSLVLLGFDAMELVALQRSRSAFLFNLATEQLHSMQERIQAYGKSDLPKQLALWNEDNMALLPLGKGHVVNDRISIFWGEKTNKRVCKQLQENRLNCIVEDIS